jgi:hypothetical protein
MTSDDRYDKDRLAQAHDLPEGKMALLRERVGT